MLFVNYVQNISIGIFFAGTCSIISHTSDSGEGELEKNLNSFDNSWEQKITKCMSDGLLTFLQMLDPWDRPNNIWFHVSSKF